MYSVVSGTILNGIINMCVNWCHREKEEKSGRKKIEEIMLKFLKLFKNSKLQIK